METAEDSPATLTVRTPIMRMEATVNGQTVDPLVFYATGRQPAGTAPAGWRPAVLAPYLDLENLRHDFPLVLTQGDGTAVISLSDAVNDLLQKIAPNGPTGEKLRRVVLRIEREIRKMAAGGVGGTLTQLWEMAAAKLDEAVASDAQMARSALDIDGAVLDCTRDMSGSLITHLWSVVQNEKARRFHAKVEKLEAALAGILRADYVRSPEGRSAASLQASIGSVHHALFDFDELSALLPKARDPLPESRRKRIAWALSALRQQRFFVVPGKPHPQGQEPYAFRFDNCGEALTAYRARAAAMAELVKAMTIAELEIDGSYNEMRHDPLLADYGANSLSAEDRAQFPDYLLVLGDDAESFDSARILAGLSSGMPFKIVANVSDLVAGTPAGDDPTALGVRGADVAGLAIGLGTAFVLQSASSNLYALSERVVRGLEFAGPAFFSVYSGSRSAALPPYLAAATAMQSRAFPAFTFDPSAGGDLASRFSLENNPRPEADWATSVLEYADRDLQRVKEEVAFTFVDFLACDPRYLHHFALPPAGFDHLVSATEWIGHSRRCSFVPWVAVSNAANELSRLIADEHAVEAARRCLENWHRLQELGGIHNSYAERLLAREREISQGLRRQDGPVVEPVLSATVPVAEEPQPETLQRTPGDAFIETSRCSSCNECTQVNSRMFAYNADKQAYVADAKAGTFAQLIEAAESCQLGIIHPGKPINDMEPDLENLIKRAEPFQ